MRTGLSRRIFRNQMVVAAVTIMSSLVVVIPVAFMINAALRPITEILAYPPKLMPGRITLRYFAAILFDEKSQQHFFNSLILALATLMATMVIAYLAAYAFSRFQLRGGQAILFAILATLIIPRIILIVPYYQLAYDFHLKDTLLGLILVNIGFTLPIAIWLLKGYIDSIPPDLEEAAMIDGCTRLQAIWKVLVPLSVPGIVGIGTFVFITAWNEYLLAVILTDSPASQPLPIALAEFFGFVARDWNSIMALSTLSSLPLVLLFVFFQRWVVQGMTRGAVK